MATDLNFRRETFRNVRHDNWKQRLLDIRFDSGKDIGSLIRGYKPGGVHCVIVSPPFDDDCFPLCF